MVSIPLTDLGRFAAAVLQTAGVPAADAALVGESIVDAHAHGKGTHGIGRLPLYIDRIARGLMRPETPLAELAAAPAMALLDAGDGLGQVAAARGMDRAISMAQTCGVGLVGVRRAHSFGAAAWVARRATAQGMAALVLSNASPAIAPTGGTRPLFGTNPIAFGLPAPAGEPAIVLDMATAEVARSKVRAAAAAGERIPLGWALDAEGRPTEDPAAALAGSMAPMGGAKGYGLSLVIDVLAGLMTGSAFAGRALALSDMSGPSNVGFLLIAIDTARFLPRPAWDAAMAELIAATRAAGPPGAVALPGGRGAAFMDGRGGQVPVSAAVLSRLDALAERTGVPPLWRS